MLIKTLDASAVKMCFLAGADAIDADKERINDLNVFPVPDGDTGTNMTMTIMSAVNEVSAIEDVTMQAVCKAVSGGSLRGARGNSGVILSQLLRGFTKELAKVEEVDVHVMAKAFERGVDSAYKAVMKPKEGTILTVARAGAEKALEIVGRTDNLAEFANTVLMHMHDVLEQTPDMLPVLKQAGVVDSGGEGLLTIMHGAYDSMIGKKTAGRLGAVSAGYAGDQAKGDQTKLQAPYGADIRFGYCTEFIILLEKQFGPEQKSEFMSYLGSIGDSIVCVEDDDIVKVHVHTNDPGLAIQKALGYGALSRMKIDNMREEHTERVIKDAERKAAAQGNGGTGHDSAAAGNSGARRAGENAAAGTSGAAGGIPGSPGAENWQYGSGIGKPDQTKVASPAPEHKENGFICVSVGAGLSRIFSDLGVDCIIEGGQTMNPSTEDILGAIRRVDADHIFILPNNSNIILAAEQARELTKDKKVIVVPSKNISQGIAAMISFVNGTSPEENEKLMREALSEVKSGQVTYAVRDSSVDGIEIKCGDVIGLSGKKIEAAGRDIVGTTVALLEKMMDGDSELVTIYYGEDASEEQAGEIAAGVRLIDKDVEVEIQYGGQPIYYYIVSVE